MIRAKPKGVIEAINTTSRSSNESNDDRNHKLVIIVVIVILVIGIRINKLKLGASQLGSGFASGLGEPKASKELPPRHI